MTASIKCMVSHFKSKLDSDTHVPYMHAQAEMCDISTREHTEQALLLS